MNRLLMTAAATALVAFAAQAQARDQIRVVGSSTVFPFSTAVAEQFGQKSGLKTPVVESTGTGGGIKLFCAGVGEDTPTSPTPRGAIKKTEVEACAKAGVTEITEVKIGFDGIVLANSKQHAPYRALREGDLAGAGQGSAGRRQDGGQSQHDLERDQPRRCRPRRSRSWARRRPPARATPSSSWCMDKACAEFPEVEALRRRRQEGRLPDHPRGRRLRRRRRERQSDRAEARAPTRRRWASSASASSTRTSTSCRAARSRASSRPSRTSPTASTRSRARSTSTSRTPMSASSRASASSSPSSPATPRSARKATSPTRA